MTDQSTPALIRTARIDLGLTQKQLGEACGYPSDTAQRYVERWESGTRTVPRDKVKAVADLLNLDPIQLL